MVEEAGSVNVKQQDAKYAERDSAKGGGTVQGQNMEHKEGRNTKGKPIRAKVE